MTKNTLQKKKVSKEEKQEDIKKAIVLYHLHQVGQYIDKIQKSLFILKNFPENEDETREALSLRAANQTLPKISKTHESDRKFLRLMEAFEDENEKIKREMGRLRKILKRDSQILFQIKNAVIQLNEPEKSVITMRYFKKMQWKEIHKKLNKSESYTFHIHAQGIKSLVSFFPKEKIELLNQAYLADTTDTFIYPKKKVVNQ